MRKKTSLSPQNQTENPEFHLFLQNEFLNRVRKNPRYSIRAFAKSLKINHSTLSQILRGKRPVTIATAIRLAPLLGLGPVEIEPFLKKIRSEDLMSSDYTQLSLDTFQVISDWYHYAIFELLTVRDFQPNYKWIAKKLDIKVLEAQSAVERLVRVGLIEIKSPRQWVQKSPLITTTGNAFTAAAFKKMQRSVLEKALQALNDVPLEMRDQSSIAMAISISLIPEAKKRIKAFRRNLCRFLQKNKTRDAVYQLGISFYPLTAVSKETHEK